MALLTSRISLTSIDFDEGQLKVLLEDGRAATGKLAENFTSKIVANNLDPMRFTQKVGVRIPHILNELNKIIHRERAA